MRLPMDVRKRNVGLLFLAALIWGFAFSAQSVGNAMGAFTFNGARCVLGALVLLPVLAMQKRLRRTEESNGSPRDTVVAGIVCGLLLMLASNLQQVGLAYTSAGKAGFITALYIVFVPLAGIPLRRGCGKAAWLGVIFSTVGLFLLCGLNGAESVAGELRGNVLVFLCAITFTAHILVVDHFSERVNGVMVSCIQFAVCGIGTTVLAFVFEEPTLEGLLSEPVALLYAGVLSCGVAYTLQIVGQKGVNPTVASLVLCLESVFSVIGGMLLLHERLRVYEVVGCVLMFAGILLAQLPSPAEKNLSKK